MEAKLAEFNLWPQLAKPISNWSPQLQLHLQSQLLSLSQCRLMAINKRA